LARYMVTKADLMCVAHLIQKAGGRLISVSYVWNMANMPSEESPYPQTLSACVGTSFLDLSGHTTFLGPGGSKEHIMVPLQLGRYILT